MCVVMSICVRDYYPQSPTVGILEALEATELKPGGPGNECSPGKREKGHLWEAVPLMKTLAFFTSGCLLHL